MFMDILLQSMLKGGCPGLEFQIGEGLTAGTLTDQLNSEERCVPLIACQTEALYFLQWLCPVLQLGNPFPMSAQKKIKTTAKRNSGLIPTNSVQTNFAGIS